VVLPSYAIVAETTGMSRREWEVRKRIIADLLEYDASERAQFGVLLRQAMDVIPGQAELASIIGTSVPSLHRWAADPKKADAALSPIQRSAIASVLSVILLHGVEAVRHTLPTV
jgi:hypothetical protein